MCYERAIEPLCPPLEEPQPIPSYHVPLFSTDVRPPAQLPLALRFVDVWLTLCKWLRSQRGQGHAFSILRINDFSWDAVVGAKSPKMDDPLGGTERKRQGRRCAGAGSIHKRTSSISQFLICERNRKTASPKFRVLERIYGSSEDRCWS